ncbi:NPCBM/NEW2 domain-containing protein [Nocardioides xinjiangensis]|uniref:NPCBM/NEW2 domain-containing protein n=1 Tax=Nocardioides xinjiangensis TaxID=2817376 RepID=UPI001B312392|nr:MULTISPECIES: NPCBM/NEW2 domain-containing protein [unclassified Nocardioides]
MNRTTVWTAVAGIAAGACALGAPVHAAPAQADAYTVTASINKTVAIGKEDVLKVRGRVTPKAAGQKVVLQQRVDGKRKWRPSGTATIKRNGTYKLQDDPSTPGTREYRVLKPASKGIAKGFSKTLTVEVYSWQRLVDRQPVATNVNVPTGVNIGAEFYGHSIATATLGAASSIEYTLGRKCTEMRATYALTDESVTGATGTVKVTGDGAVLVDHALAVGTVFAGETVDLTGVFRLRIDATRSETPAGTVAVATPEVLCTR